MMRSSLQTLATSSRSEMRAPNVRGLGKWDQCGGESGLLQESGAAQVGTWLQGKICETRKKEKTSDCDGVGGGGVSASQGEELYGKEHGGTYPSLAARSGFL